MQHPVSRRHWLWLALLFSLMSVVAVGFLLYIGVIIGVGDGPDFNSAADAERARWYVPALMVLLGLTACAWLGVFEKLLPIPMVLTAIATIVLASFTWVSAHQTTSVEVNLFVCNEVFDPAVEDPGNRCTPWVNQGFQAELVSNGDLLAHEGSSISTLELTDLPKGTYPVRLSIQIGNSGAGAAVTDVHGGDVENLGWMSYRSSGNYVVWLSTFEMRGEERTLNVLFFEGTDPRLTRSTFTYTTHLCEGQTVETFDPDACEIRELDRFKLVETSPYTLVPSWRAMNEIDHRFGATFDYLDARTYRFTPMLGNAFITENSYQFLVLPSGSADPTENMLEVNPQTGRSEFTIEASKNDTVINVDIYVFPEE